jgi:epsilon-lactone hydrolase
MTSLRASIVRAVTGAYFTLVDHTRTDVRVMRRRWNALGSILPTASGVRVTRAEVCGLAAEWHEPSAARETGLLLYLHGGAYVMGSCATHRKLVSHIARAAGIRALVPEYRLAPEYPFPAALDDSLGVYRSLVRDGHAAANILLAGDSAGGGLALATLLALRDAGDPLPAAACLLSPWLDLAGTGDSVTTRAARDPWFDPADMPAAAAHYCSSDRFRDPLVSPVYGDLAGLPPLYIQVGSDEILLSDSTRAAEKVRAAGGVVEIEIWPGMWHVFQAFVGEMPESRAAISAIGDFVRRTLAPGAGSQS